MARINSNGSVRNPVIMSSFDGPDPPLRFAWETREGVLFFTYELPLLLRQQLDPIVLVAAAQSPGDRRDELWRGNCFELFVGSPGDRQYWEYNFAINGDWNCYRFEDYREGMKQEMRVELLRFKAEETAAGLRVAVAVTIPVVGDHLRGQPAAVLLLQSRDGAGRTGYFAWRHRSDKPDFHWTPARELAF